jgi:DNA adenine methylase|nr:DNA adenine methylase [uncultured Acetatifactor sp.]
MRRVLKYSGSKWNIASQLVKLIPPHHSYIEPYFGSGAVLFNKRPSCIETINDLDGEVINLFRCIQEDSVYLARLVMTTPYSREAYDASFKATSTTGITLGDDGFRKACRFLIRCWQAYGSRNDGYKSGWKYDAIGRERMYALWDWYRLPEWIVEVGERLRKVQIECRPALEVIKRFDNRDVFIYLDPPYLLGTRSRKQYQHEMEDADHEELLKTVLRSQAQVMISGYESEMYNDYLQGWSKACFTSCADGGRRRQEVVWMNYEHDVQESIEAKGDETDG